MNTDRFPAPPRDVRRAAAFGRRGLLGVAGLVLVGAGILVAATVLVQGGGLPFDDHALDAESGVTNGEIVAREELGVHLAGGDVVRLAFRYRVGDREYRGSCHAVGAAGPMGARHPVEFLRGDPSISRLLGTSRALPAAIPWSVAVMLGGAGGILAMVWLRAGLAQRQLLREGRLVPGEVQHVHPVRLINPRRLVVDFSFRDAEQRVRTGRQWCPAGSPLGRALLGGERAVHVVHDPLRPQRNTLATPESFASAHGAG